MVKWATKSLYNRTLTSPPNALSFKPGLSTAFILKATMKSPFRKCTHHHSCLPLYGRQLLDSLRTLGNEQEMHKMRPNKLLIW